MSQSAEAAVRSLYDAILAGWNARDAQAFAKPFAPNAHVVGFDGSEIDGQDEIAEQMGAIFADHATGAYVGIVRRVQQLGDSTMLLRAVSGIVPAGHRELNPALNAVQSLVASCGDDGWRVVLYQNTPAQFHGRPELAEALTEQLSEALSSSSGPSPLEA